MKGTALSKRPPERPAAQRAVKVWLLCPGLGHVRRGFESFSRECFDALAPDPALDMTLLSGGGPRRRGEVRLWTLPRGTAFAARLARLTGQSAYFLEQLTFMASLAPRLAAGRPDVVFLSDFCLAHFVWHWRRVTRARFKILFSNGGPTHPPFPRWDHVHQVAPAHVQAACAAGEPLSKQSLVPYGIGMPTVLPELSPDARADLRRALGLPPPDRPLVLSVGVLNKAHKRMDYLVRELSALPAPRPFLVLLGQTDSETAEVRALAEELLGADGFLLRSVPGDQVPQYYQAADIMVLASLWEGLGRVLPEAQSYGLPCLAHDHEVQRFALGEYGLYGDFSQPGALTRLLAEALQDGPAPALRRARHQSAYERFSWALLRPRYVEMIHTCLQSP